MSDSIRIIKVDQQIDEETLNRYESAGWRLISVNPVTTHEYPSWSCGDGLAFKRDVVRWTYHFRVSS
jgi:hypothetical protein